MENHPIFFQRSDLITSPKLTLVAQPNWNLHLTLGYLRFPKMYTRKIYIFAKTSDLTTASHSFSGKLHFAGTSIFEDDDHPGGDSLRSASGPVVFFEGGVRNHEAHKLVVKDSATTSPSCTWKSIVERDWKKSFSLFFYPLTSPSPFKQIVEQER